MFQIKLYIDINGCEEKIESLKDLAYFCQLAQLDVDKNQHKKYWFYVYIGSEKFYIDINYFSKDFILT